MVQFCDLLQHQESQLKGQQLLVSKLYCLHEHNTWSWTWHMVPIIAQVSTNNIPEASTAANFAQNGISM
jgi:hypothetical protein